MMDAPPPQGSSFVSALVDAVADVHRINCMNCINFAVYNNSAYCHPSTHSAFPAFGVAWCWWQHGEAVQFITW